MGLSKYPKISDYWCKKVIYKNKIPSYQRALHRATKKSVLIFDNVPTELVKELEANFTIKVYIILLYDTLYIYKKIKQF